MRGAKKPNLAQEHDQDDENEKSVHQVGELRGRGPERERGAEDEEDQAGEQEEHHEREEEGQHG